MTVTRGPHGRGSRRRGREDERERLVDAFTKIAAERGYAATEVAAVVAEAGLDGSAFGAHFRDKRQCLLAAYDHFIDRLIAEIEAAMERDAPWPQQVKAGVTAALGFVVEGAETARLFAVETPAVGPPAAERYAAGIGRMAALLRVGRGRSEVAAALPSLTEAVAVAGAVSLVAATLLAEEEAGLAELEPQLVEALLQPYVGSREAHRLAV